MLGIHFITEPSAPWFCKVCIIDSDVALLKVHGKALFLFFLSVNVDRSPYINKLIGVQGKIPYCYFFDKTFLKSFQCFSFTEGKRGFCLLEDHFSCFCQIALATIQDFDM